MPWKAVLQDGDNRQFIIDLLKVLLPVIGIMANNIKLRQLQSHVRCDDECLSQHGTGTKNRRSLRKPRR